MRSQSPQLWAAGIRSFLAHPKPVLPSWTLRAPRDNRLRAWVLLAALLTGFLGVAQAQVPGLLSYQGRVSVSGSAFNGSGKFKFSLVNAGASQTYWVSSTDSNNDGQPDTNITVAVSQGIFTVLLGDTTLPNMAVLPPGIFTNSPVFLRIWFDDGTHGQAQLSPDQPLSSAAYAMMAANVADGSITPAKLAATTSLSVTSAVSSRVDGLSAQINSLSNQFNAAALSGLTVVSADPADATLAGKGFIEYSIISAPPWFTSAAAGAPSPRSAQASVWTGSEFLIWGGNVEAGLDTESGGRYRPDLDQWQDISTINAPAPREQHSAVWSGSEMLIWGGFSSNSLVSTGGRFNPTNQVWTPISTTNAPSGRFGCVAVWTGSRLLIWGGQNGTGLLADGALYDPVANTWTTLTLTNAPTARSFASAVLAGTNIVVWGGQGPLGGLNTGAKLALNGAGIPTGWTTMSTNSAPTGRLSHSAVWSGQKMLLWGGSSGGVFLASGAAYDPAANTWTTLSSTNAPTAAASAAAVWTGQEMLLYGGETIAGTTAAGAAYNPTTTKWRSLSTDGSPIASSGASSAWTGSAFLVFGGLQNGQPLGTLTSLNPQPTWYLYRKP